MSGNPFRASLVNYPSVTAPQSTQSHNSQDGIRLDSDSNTDSGVTSTTPIKTRKSVRIESPTESIPLHPAFEQTDTSFKEYETRRHNALASSNQLSGAFPSDEANLTMHRAEADARGTMRSLSEQRHTADAPSAVRGAPVNPFSRTLANMEAVETRDSKTHAADKDWTSAVRETGQNSKALLDVESFKKLLMTGIAPSPDSDISHAPGLSAAPLNSSHLDSGETTDDLRSRQVRLEQTEEPRPEPPTVSTEMGVPDHEQSNSYDKLKEKRKPPPAPVHRHGKPMPSRTPQIVSFSDFTVTETTTPPPSRQRTSMDMNRPLPPTPPIVTSPGSSISQEYVFDNTLPSSNKPTETPNLPDNGLILRKVKPPVPLARRQSQLRNSSVDNRSRSNSSITTSSQHSIDSHTPVIPTSEPTPQISSSSQKGPPPPPPPRHRGTTLPTSTSSAASSVTDVSAITTPRRAPGSPSPSYVSIADSQPPPSGHSLGRAASISTDRNSRRTVSNESSNSTGPPPLPPPRRKQSGRSSLDRERPNLNLNSSAFLPGESRQRGAEVKRNSIDSKRRTSITSESSLKYEFHPDTDTEQGLYSPREEVDEPVLMEKKDKKSTETSKILDDMDKFQQEIEELRARYQHAA